MKVLKEAENGEWKRKSKGNGERGKGTFDKAERTKTMSFS